MNFSEMDDGTISVLARLDLSVIFDPIDDDMVFHRLQDDFVLRGSRIVPVTVNIPAQTIWCPTRLSLWTSSCC